MDKENNYIELHSPALLKAVQKRNEYFQSLPEDKREEALKFQELIDSHLQKACNQNNRMFIIQGLMKHYLRELQKESYSLTNTAANLSKSIKNLSKDFN